MIKYPMKKSFLLCICSLALAGGLFAQASTETPIASPASTAAAAATSQAALPSTSASALPTATASSASSDLADKIHRKLEKKLGRKHGIIIDGGDERQRSRQVQRRYPSDGNSTRCHRFHDNLRCASADRCHDRDLCAYRKPHASANDPDDGGEGSAGSRRILAPEVRRVRRRSDVRRGVIWTMVGSGLMVWLGAVNDWEGGVWSFGLIPFLIGLGYLIVWKLEGKKDIPPPPPGP